jgi:hypothetical protein
MIKAHVFAKRCLLGVTLCALCIEVLLVSFVAHDSTSNMAGMNICNKDHLSPLVMASSFKMDVGDGQLAIVDIICI